MAPAATSRLQPAVSSSQRGQPVQDLRAVLQTTRGSYAVPVGAPGGGAGLLVAQRPCGQAYPASASSSAHGAVGTMSTAPGASSVAATSSSAASGGSGPGSGVPRRSSGRLSGSPPASSGQLVGSACGAGASGGVGVSSNASGSRSVLTLGNASSSATSSAGDTSATATPTGAHVSGRSRPSTVRPSTPDRGVAERASSQCRQNGDVGDVEERLGSQQSGRSGGASSSSMRANGFNVRRGLSMATPSSSSGHKHVANAAHRSVSAGVRPTAPSMPLVARSLKLQGVSARSSWGALPTLALVEGSSPGCASPGQPPREEGPLPVLSRHDSASGRVVVAVATTAGGLVTTTPRCFGNAGGSGGTGASTAATVQALTAAAQAALSALPLAALPHHQQHLCQHPLPGVACGGCGAAVEPEAEPAGLLVPASPHVTESDCRETRMIANDKIDFAEVPTSANVTLAAEGHMWLNVRITPNEVIKWEDIDIIRPISTGSFGEVYLATLYGERDVSVKRCILNVGGSMTKEQLHNLEREINTYRMLDHPQIVKYIGCVLEHPNLAIVTEYIPNGNVFDLLYTNGVNLPSAHRRKIACQVTLALCYMHSSDPVVIHRDLKTQNLVLDWDFNVKLCDFGKTLSLDENNPFIMSMDNGGSPRYMAPECFYPGAIATEKVDIWSLACCIIEIFGGPLPYEDIPQMTQVRDLIVHHQQPPLVPPWFTPEVIPILTRSFHFSAPSRPHIGEVQLALKGVSVQEMERCGMSRRRIR
eukprot:TRINITY_DN4495_c0_g1_i1.p1 TRINITY_DN4495_c0_g1~~TRINITY_DN4495_c0_g1_i1.p1  ORF type:complete len:812 (-),score=98.50 TRINITY_DN4495_c0_g1_i1:114-2396(-)